MKVTNKGWTLYQCPSCKTILRVPPGMLSNYVRDCSRHKVEV